MLVLVIVSTINETTKKVFSVGCRKDYQYSKKENYSKAKKVYIF